MISRTYALALAGIACAATAAAQKKQYTMAEAVNGIATNLAPKAIKYPSWRPGTHEFSYVASEHTIGYNAAGNRIDTGGTVQEWNRKFYRGEAPAGKAFTDVKWLDKERSWFQIDSTLVIAGRRDRVVIPLAANAANITPLPANGPKPYVAATVDNNLVLYGAEGAVALTRDADRNIISGQAVHRNEFGIDRGIFCSPKGSYVAYYRMDQTMVADYPVIDWSTVPARNENVKYPMAGRTSHQVTLRVYSIHTGKTIELKTGAGKDHYLTCVTWSPDEQYLYVAILNRQQNHLWLNQYDARTGEKIKTLFEETDDKYVEPQHPLSFLPGSNDQFIWWSQRDGYMHLYLCDLGTNKMRCLTPGKYVVNELLAFNERRSEVLFTAARQDPREKHGYAVNWKTGAMRQLDDPREHGTHNYTASDDGEYLYEVYTGEPAAQTYRLQNGAYELKDAPERLKPVAKRSQIRAVDGKVSKVLLDADNPLAGYARPSLRDVELKADDGTRLYGKLILPTDFDPRKQYPVIVYLYNGPHVQLIKNGFPGSGNLWYEYLAQHGYIVWTMDGRGSSNRGQKFEQAVFRQLGTVEMQDQMVGVNFLRSLPYVDSKRLGIHGWSFGGFMTTSFMLRNPGVFKVAVAGGPVMDWSMYEVMYGERYMDTPEENPKGYAESNLLTKVRNLKGRLLLIHGTQDATVVWQHSINFLKKSVDENVQVDYFVYPGYEHNVRGRDRVHLMQKVTDYFDQHL